MYVGHKMYYDGYKKGTYHNQPCLIYYLYDKTGTTYCYATDDNYVLKVEVLLGVYPGSSSSENGEDDSLSSSSSHSSSSSSTSSFSSSSSLVPTGLRSNVTYAYEYSFEDVPLSAFDFSENITEECPKGAYDPPTKRLCPDHSGSSSSGGSHHSSGAGSKSSSHAGMASTAKVTFAVLIASIVAAFISLY